MSAHRLVVLGVRKLGQVALPVSEPAPHLAKVAPRYAAVAPFTGRLRIQHEQPVDGADDAIPLLAPPVRALEIGEHPRDELASADRSIVLRLEGHGPAQDAPDQLRALFRRHERAAVERIQQNLRVTEPGPGNEMSREADALDVEPEPLAHLHQHEAQRDRYAQAAVQHVVEEAVAGVVIVVPIAGEALLDEEVL